MSRAAPAPHEQDLRAAGLASRATLFSAFLFCGPGARYRREAHSFEEAVDEAISLEHDYETTRRALVYAIPPSGESVPIDETVARLAGFPEEAIARLFDRG